MSGVPQLLFPVQYEQFLTATRIAQLGAGLALLPAASAAEVANALRSVLTDARFKAAARAYAKRYPAYSPAEQQRRIVKRIEDILAAPVDGGEPHA
jgi:UDP:flavonoid glycosyltransferase YjiC (YdhE family)